MSNKLYIAFLLLLSIYSCKPNINKDKLDGNDGQFTSGDANFTAYVALGGSMASGFQDKELYKSGQEASYPNILQNIFRTFKANKRNRGYMFDEFGFGNRTKLVLQEDCRGELDNAFVKYSNRPNGNNTSNISSQGPFVNYALPNTSLSSMFQSNYASSNLYYKRIVSQSNNSVLQEVQAIQPSFFTLSFDHDVLQTAITGFALTNNTLPSVNNFRTNLNNLINALSVNGAKGAIATFPHLRDYPFFKTVAYNALDITQEQADQLNLLYILNPNITFQEGPNPFVIQDGISNRQMEANEFVLLSIDVDSIKCGNYGSIFPFDDADVLTADEIESIESRIDALNQIIRDIALQHKLALVALDVLYKDLTSGINVRGFEHNSTFIEGLFFSVDGLNPAPRGHAIIANTFVDAINKQYRARLPKADVLSYRTVLIP